MSRPDGKGHLQTRRGQPEAASHLSETEESGGAPARVRWIVPCPAASKQDSERGRVVRHGVILVEISVAVRNVLTHVCCLSPPLLFSAFQLCKFTPSATLDPANWKLVVLIPLSRCVCRGRLAPTTTRLDCGILGGRSSRLFPAGNLFATVPCARTISIGHGCFWPLLFILCSIGPRH